MALICHLTLRNNVHFKYLSLTTAVQPGYCHLKTEVATDVVVVVMLCFGLMLHPPSIYQSRSR